MVFMKMAFRQVGALYAGVGVLCLKIRLSRMTAIGALPDVKKSKHGLTYIFINIYLRLILSEKY